MQPDLQHKVLVAMSGGVDSCVSAALLAEAGYDVVGITMRVVPEEQHHPVFQPCCSVEMAKDARQVADRFGFPHYTVNYVAQFDQLVVQDFESEYLQGRTPNPCVRCNQRLKFGSLYKKAVELGASKIATGHYVRLTERDGRFGVRKAVHLPKDQSYVMAGLTQKQLAMSIFPLGEMTKAQTRAKARELGLAAAETPESQDICFVPDNDYKGFLQRRIGPAKPGPILATDGSELGRHTGLINYTVGQRRGLGIGGGAPYYVVRLDAARNAVIVGREEETRAVSCVSDQIKWGLRAPRPGPFECRVQIRYHHEPVRCTVTPGANELHVEFAEPERSVTPGQWSVFYDENDTVLAAGIIRDFVSAKPETAHIHASG